MQFYKTAFGINPPYKVLCDVSFIENWLKHKIRIADQLPNILGDACTPTVTSCMMEELRSKGKVGIGPTVVAKNFYRMRCGHREAMAAANSVLTAAAPVEPSAEAAAAPGKDDDGGGVSIGVRKRKRGAESGPPKGGVESGPQDPTKATSAAGHAAPVKAKPTSLSTAACFKRVLEEHKRKYCVATQDAWLLRHVRRKAGTPVVRLEGNVPVVEGPSDASRNRHRKAEERKTRLPKWEREVLNLPDPTEEAKGGKVVPGRKKRKGGPNPLSVKKAAPKPLSPPRRGTARLGGQPGEGEEAGSGGPAAAVDSSKSRRRRKRRKTEDDKPAEEVEVE